MKFFNIFKKLSQNNSSKLQNKPCNIINDSNDLNDLVNIDIIDDFDDIDNFDDIDDFDDMDNFGDIDDFDDMDEFDYIDDIDERIAEITRKKQAESEKLHAEFIKEINKFNIDKIDPTIVDNSPLSSVEKSFLQYMNGKTVINPYVAGYWSFEYGINYNNCMSKLVYNGYLRKSSCKETIKSMTIPELKVMLKKLNLKQSGRKQELLDRLSPLITEELAANYIPPERITFSLTEKGEQILEGVKPSATKDLEFEDKCLELIHNKRFSDAYLVVYGRELNKPFPSVIDIDYKKPLEDSRLQAYEYLYSMSENTKLIEAIIFCDMIRVSQKGAVPLLDRLNLSEYTNQFRYLNHSQQSIRDILSLKESNYQKFEILVCDDACPTCRKMRNKKFKVSEAKLGVNLPPFCDNCRCTILPVIGSR